MFHLIVLTALSVIGFGSFIVFVVCQVISARRHSGMFRRPSRTPKLVYLFVPVILACFLVPPFLAELFWRTLDTEIPFTVILLLNLALGHFLVRKMRRSSLFAEVEGGDRFLCCAALFLATLLLPFSLLLILNNASLQSPSYSRIAVVTNMITGRGKTGGIHDYLAFEGPQVSDWGGVQVSPVLYASVARGSIVVVYLKKGWLGFPVVVGVAQG